MSNTKNKSTKAIHSPNDPASLFIGRWQPFHDGHKKLIETVLKQGKPVVIGIRDTGLSKKNPYTVTERWTMIQEALKKYSSLVKIIRVPDIDEVVYGREVGYLIRRVHLDGETEGISATSIRSKKKVKTHPIIWLTGQSGSGKSTIAKALHQKIGGVILDGDEMRQSISLNAGFGKEDRLEHNLRVARLAGVLAQQSPVIVAVIAPFIEARRQVDQLIDVTWVYVKRKLPKQAHKPYQPPPKPAVTVDVDRYDIDTNFKKVLDYLS